MESLTPTHRRCHSCGRLSPSTLERTRSVQARASSTARSRSPFDQRKSRARSGAGFHAVTMVARRRQLQRGIVVTSEAARVCLSRVEYTCASSPTRVRSTSSAQHPTHYADQKVATPALSEFGRASTVGGDPQLSANLERSKASRP